MEIMFFQQFGFPVDKKCCTHVQVEMGEPIDLKREDKKMVSTPYPAPGIQLRGGEGLTGSCFLLKNQF